MHVWWEGDSWENAGRELFTLSFFLAKGSKVRRATQSAHPCLREVPRTLLAFSLDLCARLQKLHTDERHGNDKGRWKVINMGGPRLLNLSDVSVELFPERLRRQQRSSRWVFPQEYSEKMSHLHCENEAVSEAASAHCRGSTPKGERGCVLNRSPLEAGKKSDTSMLRCRHTRSRLPREGCFRSS